MTFAVVVTTAISLSLLGIGLLSNAQVGAMKDYWYDKIEVSVFLCGNLSDSASCAAGAVTADQRLSIQQDLQEMSVVDSVFYESQSQSFCSLPRAFQGFSDCTECDCRSNFLSHSE
jgi:cell division transport system permease protein